MLIRNVQLLGTEGCHLCDLASSVLGVFNEAMQVHDFRLHVDLIDISSSEAMVAQYGPVIPVLIDTYSRQELAWPFDERSVYEFLRVCDDAG